MVSHSLIYAIRTAIYRPGDGTIGFNEFRQRMYDMGHNSHIEIPSKPHTDALNREEGLGRPDLAQGTKFDGGKTRLDLLSPSVLTEVGRVLTFGAQKYAPRNWEKGIDYSRCYGAALRHMIAWSGGERLDPEMKTHHLANAITNLMFVLHYELNPTLYSQFNDIPALAAQPEGENNARV